MIATITLNPSVDICYYMDNFNNGDINRCNRYIKTAGGKGINVSKVLRKLDCDVVATGFMGGATGAYIEQELDSMSIVSSFTKINEDTRNCIAIITDNTQTEILESGPKISEKESEIFLENLSNIFDSYSIKVASASGSIPESLGEGYYNRIIEIARERGIKFVLDTGAEFLSRAIQTSPYLIKPNIAELESFMNVSIKSERDLIMGIEKFKQYSMEMVVVSLGDDGCIALCGDNIYRVAIPDVVMKSAVGSGDAMVAGMVKEIERDSDFEEILRVGTTCGILNAMNERTGNIDMKLFSDIYGKIRIEMIK